jgi:hypothetical protein
MLNYFINNLQCPRHGSTSSLSTNLFICVFHALTYAFASTNDALPSSLIDLNVSLNQNNGRVRSWGHVPWLATLWGRGVCWNFEMGLWRMPKWDYEEWQALNHSHEHAQNQTRSWLVHSWSTFGARISHGQIRTHKTHHNLDLGEATTFPL